MSDSNVTLGTAGYSSIICQYRLPCGYCQLRNMMCSISTCVITPPCKPWWEQVYCTTDPSDKTITASMSGESK